VPRINEALLNLRASYLFAEVKRRTQAHHDAHPGVRLIDLGIGDVTLPLRGVVVQALEDAAREQARAETLRGYGREDRPRSAAVPELCPNASGRQQNAAVEA